MTFGQLLRSERERAGKTLRQLAAHLDLSATYLSNVERDRNHPFADSVIKRTAAFLGVDERALLAAAIETRGVRSACLVFRRFDTLEDAARAYAEFVHRLTGENVRWPTSVCPPVAEAAGLSVEAVVYTMRRALGVVAADRMRDGTRLPRVTLPRGSRLTVIEGRLAS